MEGAHKDHRVQTLGSQKDHPKMRPCVLRVLSKYFLNYVRLGAVTTALGSPFQCLTTLSVGVLGSQEPINYSVTNHLLRKKSALIIDVQIQYQR